MSYQVFIPKSVQKDLDTLPVNASARIKESIYELEEQPRPPGCKKPQGEKAWRIRIGDYRVIFEIHDKTLIVVVVTVGHRREVYR